MNIYLLNYNNYFNRIVKIESTIEKYAKYLVCPITNGNLKPNDGVETELVVSLPLKSIIPDYVVIYDPIESKINSRWFVLDASRNRSGQYLLSLRRDVIVDNFNEAMSAKAYIEKGYVPKSNPLILNKEGISFNQIKTKEKKLWDKTKCAWVVGYMDAKQTEQINIQGKFDYDEIPSLSTYPLLDAITDSSGKIVLGEHKIVGDLDLKQSNIEFNIGSVIIDNSWWGEKYYKGYYMPISQPLGNVGSYLPGPITKLKEPSFGTPFGTWNSQTKQVAALQIYNNEDGANSKNVLDIANKFNGIDLSASIPLIRDIYNNNTNADIELAKTMGTIFEDDQSGKYYKITISFDGNTEDKTYIGGIDPVQSMNREPYINNNTLYTSIINQIKAFAITNGFNKNGIVPNIPDFQMTMLLLKAVMSNYTINVSEVSSPGIEWRISIDTNSNNLKDAPYKMFCFPYEGKVKVGTDEIYMDKSKALNVAMAFNKELQNKIFDIQLLPYCPIANWFIEGDYNVLKSGYDVNNINYSLINYGTSEVAGVIFYPKFSRFTFNIPLSIQNNYEDNYEYKVRRETELYRIVSPNFANFQKIDPYMNEGIDFINVDCTYKPITPYIKLNINYKYIYGADFDDDRGLILGGDFSLPLLTDQWKQYEIQNKNYSNIFDREQEHIATEHKYGMVTKGINAVSSAANAAAGSQYGPGGMAIAGVQSLLFSGIGMAQSQLAYNENKDYRKDMFDFNLQNIQARPQGLVRTSAFNYNNKLVPFIEKYEATEVERVNFYNKLKFNGMLIEAIGQPIDYFNPKEMTFIKCKIIRFNKLLDDNHMATAIAEELDSGIYYELEEDYDAKE